MGRISELELAIKDLRSAAATINEVASTLADMFSTTGDEAPDAATPAEPQLTLEQVRAVLADKSRMSNSVNRATNPMKVITGPDTRWSYANVWEPKSINGGAAKYSVSLIIPKSDTKTVAKINGNAWEFVKVYTDFDLRTTDSAYSFVLDTLGITGEQFIDEYIIECDRDYERLWEKYYRQISTIVLIRRYLKLMGAMESHCMTRCMYMSRKLVAYFSASGHTAKVAEHLAEAIGADLFEIIPKVRYTNECLILL